MEGKNAGEGVCCYIHVPHRVQSHRWASTLWAPLCIYSPPGCSRRLLPCMIVDTRRRYCDTGTEACLIPPLPEQQVDASLGRCSPCLLLFGTHKPYRDTTVDEHCTHLPLRFGRAFEVREPDGRGRGGVERLAMNHRCAPQSRHLCWERLRCACTADSGPQRPRSDKRPEHSTASGKKVHPKRPEGHCREKRVCFVFRRNSAVGSCLRYAASLLA